MARVAGGDALAFNELLARHSRAVLNICYRIVHDQAEAEDLCQEVFATLWQQAPSWRAEAKLQTWLYRVASNRAINHHQRVQQRHQVDTVRAEEMAEERDTHSADIAGFPEDGGDMLAIIKILPENQRMALYFRYYLDMSSREIADILGVSLKSVESLLARGRSRLKQQISAEALFNLQESSHG